jgi:hypothetical protein
MSSMAALNSSDLGLFDDREAELVTRGLSALALVASADASTLRASLQRLANLSRAVQATPSLHKPDQFAGHKRSRATLIDHLCDTDGLSGELDLPMKATLSRTFLVAKIQFLRGFVRATRAQVESGPEFLSLETDLREELAQSIYTLLAEELLLALLRKPEIPRRIKRRAADQLIIIWEDAEIEIDDFCPLLESAWHARNRVNADLGSLLGTSEFFRLVCEDCSQDFLNFFARDEVSVQEKEAFEEFLFDVTYEELSALRQTMRKQNLDSISPKWASETLGRKLERETNTDGINPIALYRSYNRRQLAADFRIVTDRPGPRRTAEAYMMIYLLESDV